MKHGWVSVALLAACGSDSASHVMQMPHGDCSNRCNDTDCFSSPLCFSDGSGGGDALATSGGTGTGGGIGVGGSTQTAAGGGIAPAAGGGAAAASGGGTGGGSTGTGGGTGGGTATSACAAAYAAPESATDQQLYDCALMMGALQSCFVTTCTTGCSCTTYVRSTQLCSGTPSCASPLSGTGCSDGNYYSGPPFFCTGTKVTQSACMLRYLIEQGYCSP